MEEQRSVVVDLQGAPIKNNPLGKFIISVTITDLFTKFTAFTEEDFSHIHSKFCYNICYGLNLEPFELKSTVF